VVQTVSQKFKSSISPALEACLRYLGEILEQQGFTVKFYDFTPGRTRWGTHPDFGSGRGEFSA